MCVQGENKEDGGLRCVKGNISDTAVGICLKFGVIKHFCAYMG